MDRLIFHNPNTEIGIIDLATSQVNKQMLFQFSQAVSLQSKIVIATSLKLVKEYTVGSGLTLSNGNQDVTFVLNGADFIDYKLDKLTVSCSFFNIGDVEMEFELKIVDSKL
jgi:hypothetical protein